MKVRGNVGVADAFCAVAYSPTSIATSDSTGGFDITTNLPSGLYVFYVSHDEYLTHLSSINLQSSTAEYHNIDIKLKPATISGRFLGVDGTAYADQTVSLFLNRNTVDERSEDTTTDATGGFVFSSENSKLALTQGLFMLTAPDWTIGDGTDTSGNTSFLICKVVDVVNDTSDDDNVMVAIYQDDTEGLVYGNYAAGDAIGLMAANALMLFNMDLPN